MAEGIDALVLDVKTGSGAFMKKHADAEYLAQLMVETGKRMGKKIVALLTDMEPAARTQSRQRTRSNRMPGNYEWAGPGRFARACATNSPPGCFCSAAASHTLDEGHELCGGDDCLR